MAAHFFHDFVEIPVAPFIERRMGYEYQEMTRRKL